MPLVVYMLLGNMRWKPWSAAAILTGFFEATMTFFEDDMSTDSILRFLSQGERRDKHNRKSVI